MYESLKLENLEIQKEFEKEMFMKPIIEVIKNEIRCECEDEILKAVMKFGVNLDKVRLIKALEDSRQYYDEGYEDAMKKYKTEWIPCSERLPKEHGWYLVQYSKELLGGLIIEVVGYDERGFLGSLSDVLAWMPLPEPYQEEKDEKIV